MEQKRLSSVLMASSINSYPGQEYPSSSFSEESNKKSKCILNKINLKKYFNSKSKYSFDDGVGSKLSTCLSFFKRRSTPIFSSDDRSIFSISDSSDVRSLSDSDVNNIIDKDEETDAFAERIRHSINSFSRRSNVILIEKGKYSENDMLRIMNFLQVEYCSVNKNAKDESLYKNVKVIANYKVLDGKECYEIKIKKFFTMNERDKEEVDQTLGILSDVLKKCAERKGNTGLSNKITGMRCRDCITLLDYVKDLDLDKINDGNEEAIKKCVAENNSELQSKTSNIKNSASINVSGGVEDLKDVGLPGAAKSYSEKNSRAIFERDVENISPKYVNVVGKKINIELRSVPGDLIAGAASFSVSDNHFISGNVNESEKKEYIPRFTEWTDFVINGQHTDTETVIEKVKRFASKINIVNDYFIRKEKIKHEKEKSLIFLEEMRSGLKSANIKKYDKLDWGDGGRQYDKVEEVENIAMAESNMVKNEMDGNKYNVVEKNEVIAKENSFVIDYNIGIHEEFKVEAIEDIGKLHGMDPILEKFLEKGVAAPAA